MFVLIKIMSHRIFKALFLIILCFASSACLVSVLDSGPTASAADGDIPPDTFLPFIATPQNVATEDPAVQAPNIDQPSTQDILIEDLLARSLAGQNSGNPDIVIVASGATYYVDCAEGDDGNHGTSQAAAWKTMAKANSASLAPGDRLRFKRDCSWTGPLDASWRGTASQPIVISSYGSGELPKIQDGYSSNVRISGSYLILENLHVTMSSPPNPDPNCKNQPVGWKAGFSFQDGAAHNTVQYSKATKLAIGIFFSGDTHNNKALNNTITNNHVVWELAPTRTLGAMGILLQGDSQEVGHNYFAGNKTICTYTGTIESNSIELYAATNSTIHHNTSYGDRVFSEMGSSPSVRSENNTYAYNLHVTSLSDPYYGARFIVTRGWNHAHGPVLGTKVYNNTVYHTGSGSKGVVCELCGEKILALDSNILWVNREPFSSDGPFEERNNIFWDGNGSPLLNVYGFALSNTSQISDPQFVDAKNGNFNLKANSPAVNKGTRVSAKAGFDYDLWQTITSVDEATDIGAYEHRKEPWQRVFHLPSRIEAEDYRNGGPGVGYSDTTEGNSGGVYRNDGVDIEVTQDSSGNYDVGWIAAGEWLSYDIIARATGFYQVFVRVSTPSGSRQFHIEIDGENVTGSVTIPWTGDWQSWVDVPVLIPLKAGRHTLRLVAETDRFNVNYLIINKIQ